MEALWDFLQFRHSEWSAIRPIRPDRPETDIHAGREALVSPDHGQLQSHEVDRGECRSERLRRRQTHVERPTELQRTAFVPGLLVETGLFPEVAAGHSPGSICVPSWNLCGVRPSQIRGGTQIVRPWPSLCPLRLCGSFRTVTFSEGDQPQRHRGRGDGKSEMGNRRWEIGDGRWGIDCRS